MPPKDDRVRLLHMKEAAQKNLEFTSGKTRSTLDADEILYNALTWLFQVTGEAANHVTKEFKGEHSEFEWEDIVNFRNRIVHGYDNIDTDIMWSIIQHDVPDLVAKLNDLDLDR